MRVLRRSLRPVVRGARLAVALLAAAVAARAAVQDVAHAGKAPFLNFESGPVNALLLAPDGRTLYVLNTPDDRVELLTLPPVPVAPGRAPHGTGAAGGTAAPGGPVAPGGTSAGGSGGGLALAMQPAGAVFTGLEPVAMALHPQDAGRLFVSNHVSDTVSVVDVVKRQVVATIRVGDEPQGLAIAHGLLFVACARAPVTPLAPGQSEPGPMDQHVVVVTQAEPPYAWIANVPIGAVKPRDVLAVGGTIHVIPQNSGNHTTLIDETQTTNLGLEQLLPDPFDGDFEVNAVLERPEFAFPAYTRGWIIPTAGRIVFDSEHPTLAPQLADRDIVALDADSLLPLPNATTGVGTTLFDLERNPATGALWITNSEAHNRIRFEPVLRGAALDNRVAIALPGGPVQQSLVLAPPLTPHAHSQPATLAFSDGPAGRYAFIACLGSASVVVLDAVTAAFVAEIACGELPSGLAVDDARGVLHVFCRGAGEVRSYDLRHGFAALGPARALSYDPEPLAVRTGRTHLYDARAATGHGNGTMSCASCHVFAHDDQLAWDLGNPGGSFAYYYPDVMTGLAGFPDAIVTAPSTPILNPLKGPMVTQSLRGLLDPDTKDDLPLHWRGDRRTLHQFRGAFEGLLGGTGLDGRQVQEFAGFVRSLRYSPNPNGPRNRVYTGQAAQGRDIYGLNAEVPGKEYVINSGFLCAKCHMADFDAKTDFTGGRPTVSSGSFTQLFNTAQLRMIYEKDFRFVSGFGALHDGAVDGVRGFMDFVVPNGGLPTFSNFTKDDKDAVATFVKAWDSGLSALVGAQYTLSPAVLLAPGGVAAADAELDLYEAQAQPPASNVDLVVKGFRIGPDGSLLPRGAHYRFEPALGAWGYRFDTGAFVSRQVLLDIVGLGLATFTFTCVPPGTGERLGIDRDEDGSADWQETQAGTDPADPDTDGDGYLDGSEAALGGNPSVADVSLPDTAPPVVSPARAVEIFADIATLACGTDEPATVTVDLGLAAGSYALASVAGPPGLRRVHDVILPDLPAGTTLFFRVRAADRDGHVGTAEGSFTTLPQLLHVADITLAKSGGTPAGTPVTVQATVLVQDHTGAPRAGVPVRGFWAGEIGGQAWEQVALTNAQGRATFTLAPFVPAPPAPGVTHEVTFSPAYIGTPFPNQAWFVGLGGDTPTFFYDQTANAVHFRTVVVP